MNYIKVNILTQITCIKVTILSELMLYCNIVNFNFLVFSAPLTRGPGTPHKFSSNSSVFNCLLNERVFWTKRMETGSPFQAFGPATLKARSPNFSLVRFMTKEKLDPDRSSRLSWKTKHGVTISFRYEGLRLFAFLPHTLKQLVEDLSNGIRSTLE